MPRISVFTPSHRPDYLDDCWKSLEGQTFRDFEWVVVLNGGARWTPPDDGRVRLLTVDQLRGVGAAKGYACDNARGEILVELDHDDVLATTALAQVNAEFEEHPDAAFVYSDCAQVMPDLSADKSTWDTSNGWEYGPVLVDGQPVISPRSLEPTPHNMSLIWFQPNHLRAFQRGAYRAAGGYDADRDILDDQDLMCRLYQTGEFRHIDACLYLQRVHDGMTQRDPELNARIQVETVKLYDRYVEGNLLAWTKRSDLMALDLGGAHASPEGYLSVDTEPGVDLQGDVFDVLDKLDDSSVGVIRAVDFLEHVQDSVRLMNEIWRVLAPGAMLLSCTPSTDGRGAFQAPDHVSFFNENSFAYYCEADFARYVPSITARFQMSRCVTYHPSDWHRERQIPYVQANLIALKPGGARNGGHLMWPA